MYGLQTAEKYICANVCSGQSNASILTQQQHKCSYEECSAYLHDLPGRCINERRARPRSRRCHAPVSGKPAGPVRPSQSLSASVSAAQHPGSVIGLRRSQLTALTAARRVANMTPRTRGRKRSQRSPGAAAPRLRSCCRATCGCSKIS